MGREGAKEREGRFSKTSNEEELLGKIARAPEELENESYFFQIHTRLDSGLLKCFIAVRPNGYVHS